MMALLVNDWHPRQYPYEIFEQPMVNRSHLTNIIRLRLMQISLDLMLSENNIMTETISSLT